MSNSVSHLDHASITRLFTSTSNIPIDPEIFPAATDSRYVRYAGIPAFGISPLRNTPILLHDHDEFVYESGFLEGIQVYQHLIKALADTPPF
jgi:aminoacylase